MRLINTSNLAFEEFEGTNIPSYVILSHTWEKEEVTYKDYVEGRQERMAGFSKIRKTCEIGREQGYKYAWVDTCCIDKRSSAELTEAINSMYRWYMRAEVCYAFLSDLAIDGALEENLPNCRWFTRGWTLQELIAPENVQFYDKEWNNRGSKESMASQLAQITNISRGVLEGKQSLSGIAVAQKMSWAGNRQTTRIEDLAYCLLGIFDVNMPLLYGEEEKAFRRLQEEIIKTTADFSIFGWNSQAVPGQEEPQGRVFCGILAQSPADFANCGSFTTQSTLSTGEFSITNTGVKTRVQVLIQPIPGEQGFRYVLPLNSQSNGGKYIGVRLRKCGSNIFVREDPRNILEYDEHLNPDALSDIYLLIKLPETITHPQWDTANFISMIRLYALQIRLPRQMYVYDAWPRGRFDDEDQLFFASDNSQRDYGALRISVLAKTRVPGRDVEFEFECMFYALGWSAAEPENLQCTLIDYEAFAKPLNEVQSLIVDWDHSRQQVLTSLDYHRIPKTSAIAVKIPNTQRSVYMTFTPKLRKDRAICKRKFWRIEFQCEIYETAEVPTIKAEEWAVEND